MLFTMGSQERKARQGSREGPNRGAAPPTISNSKVSEWPCTESWDMKGDLESCPISSGLPDAGLPHLRTYHCPNTGLRIEGGHLLPSIPFSFIIKYRSVLFGNSWIPLFWVRPFVSTDLTAFRLSVCLSLPETVSS